MHNVPKFIKHIYVIFVLLIGYVLFSINNINDIILFIKILFTGPLYNNEFLLIAKNNMLLIIIGIILCFKKPNFITRLEDNRVVSIMVNIFVVLLFIVSISYVLSGNFMPSLYRGF